MDIAREEWIFARRASQWICLHQDIYNDAYAMSMQTLLKVTELSACNETHQEEIFEYDAERLRQTVGSLVTVDEEKMVFLAHYTVKEYLEFQRLTGSALSYFQVGQKATTGMLMQVIVQQSQRKEWSEEREHLIYDGDVFGHLICF
jgi:hypothetical protein